MAPGMQKTILAAVMLAPLLAACGSGGGNVQSASAAPAASSPQARHSRLPAVRAPVRAAPPAAQRLAAPGLEGVIGATRGDLSRQFGAARLDVWEGDARKLQYAGSACVLDIYLYPSSAGREPQATYVDARRASDGKDVDRASCIGALRQRGNSPAASAGG